MPLTGNILKSLDKEEIKFVEKTAFEGKDSQAKTLFDLMQKFGEEEEKIDLRFKRAAPKGNISVVRHQLGQILLDTLYNYHAPEYEFAEVNELILQISLFSRKSAFEVVKKLLDKGLSKAEENELFTQQIELLEIKLSLFQARILVEKQEKEITKNLILEVWNKKQNALTYQLLLFEQMELLSQNFTLRSAEGQALFEKIRGHELMASEVMALSIKAKLNYYIIKGQYFSIANNYLAAAEAFEQLIALLDAKPSIKKQHNLAYLSICAQLATYGYILQQPELMQKAITAINVTEKNNEIERIAAGTFIINSNMAYYDLVKDKAGLKQTINEAHVLLKLYAKKMKHDVCITLLIATVSGYAEFGEYAKVLEMLQEFDASIFATTRVDAKVTLFFYELIALIETGKQQMVNNTIQNFNRYLLRNDFKGEFEQIMVRFLKVISSNAINLSEELSQLKTQLSELPQKSILSQNRVLYQILVTMIDSRLAGKKFHAFLGN